MKSIEIDKQRGKDYDISGESLTVRGIYDKRDSKSKDRHISKSQANKGKCHYCKTKVLVWQLRENYKWFSSIRQ